MPYSLGVPVKATHARISQGVTRLPISIDGSPGCVWGRSPAPGPIRTCWWLDRVRQQGKKLERPKVGRKVEEAIRARDPAAGYGILKVAAMVRCGSGTVQRLKEGDGWTVDRGCVIAVDLVSPAHKPDTSVKADTARSSPKSRLMRWLGRGRGDLGVTQ